MAKTLMRSVVPKAKLIPAAKKANETTSEIAFLYKELETYFKKEQWPQLTDLLETVAKLGEKNGQKELCLKSQSLRVIMAGRTLKYAPENSTFNQMSELFDEILFHLSHLNWQNEGNNLSHVERKLASFETTH